MAYNAPPQVRSIGAQSSDTAAMTLGTPAGVLAGDLLIAFIECSAAITISGWTHHAASPSTGSGSSQLAILYRIADLSDNYVTSDTGNHQHGRVLCIRGGTFDENNIFGAYNSNQQASTQSISISGITTTRDNSLVISASAGDLPDSTNATEYSAEANADLTEIVVQTRRSDTVGDGGALLVVTGRDTTAGSVGATTATKVSSAVAGNIMLAVNATEAPVMYAWGTMAAFASGTTITTTIPSGAVADDIMVLLLEHSTNGNTFSTPSGWTDYPGGGAQGTSAEFACFWKRHSGSESDPASTVSITMTSGEGGYGRIALIKNCKTSGTPFEQESKDTQTTQTPSTGSVTTTGAKRLCMTLLAVDDNELWSSGMPPTGYNQMGITSSATGGDAMTDGIWKYLPTATTEGSVTIGTLTASEIWGRYTFAFIPASGGATEHTVGALAITASPALDVASMSLSGLIGALAVTGSPVLDVAQSTVSRFVAPLDLTGSASITVQNSYREFTVGSLDLTGTGTITVAGATKEAFASAEITGTPVLAVGSTVREAFCGALALAGVPALDVGSTLREVPFGPLALTGSGLIVVQSAEVESSGEPVEHIIDPLDITGAGSILVFNPLREAIVGLVDLTGQGRITVSLPVPYTQSTRPVRGISRMALRRERIRVTSDGSGSGRGQVPIRGSYILGLDIEHVDSDTGTDVTVSMGGREIYASTNSNTDVFVPVREEVVGPDGEGLGIFEPPVVTDEVLVEIDDAGNHKSVHVTVYFTKD